jgi:low affinity Fe/Cu permease
MNTSTDHPRNRAFDHLAKAAARATGRPMAFLLAAGGHRRLAGYRPDVRHSDTWQLVVNTATTVVTFLHGLPEYRTPRRAIPKSIQIKLDELHPRQPMPPAIR